MRFCWPRTVALIGTVGTLILGCMAQEKPSTSSSIAERISRIENGLVPNSVAKGEPLPQYNIAERMRHYHVPGLSAAFIEDGKIVWVRTYGVADVTTGAPVTPATLFQAASISKPVTAVAVMKLVQQGKLHLDEDVNRELTTWKVPEGDTTKKEKVPVQRLLSHTAGLTVHGFAGYAEGEPLPTLVNILNGQKPANSDPVRVEAVPGTAFNYSGGGYVVLRTLMSDITRTPFPDLMKQLVLEPMGMAHSTFAQPLPRELWKVAASAHQSDGQPFPGRFHTYPELAPDGLWTTATDLAKFAIEIQKAIGGRSAVISQETAREMLTEQMKGYALGFRVGNEDGKNYFEHDGSNYGFFSEMIAYTGAPGQGLIILTNGNNINLRLEFERAVAREYKWRGFEPTGHVVSQDVPASILASYAATYVEPEVGRIVVTFSDGKLKLDANGMRIQDEQMFPEGKDQFFIQSSNDTFEFLRDASGKVTSLATRSHMGAQGLLAKRQP